MLNRIRQIFSKASEPLAPEDEKFIRELAESNVWLLAIGIRGTPSIPAKFDDAIEVVAQHRVAVSELGDDAIFAFNFEREGEQLLPFFGSEEMAAEFVRAKIAEVDLTIFEPCCLLAGFVTAPENKRFRPILNPGSNQERLLTNGEASLLRSLTAGG